MTTNWIGWMLSVLVLLLLILAGYIVHNSIGLLITGKRAEGTVVAMDTTAHIASEPRKESLKSPVVEFVTLNGERIRVSGKSYSNSPAASIGSRVFVAYSNSNPSNAQILSWKEFPLIPVVFIVGFAVFILLIWISGILISGDSSIDDPFHLLPALISRFKLNPVRFPVIFLLSIVIPACLTVTYVYSKRALDLHYNGIKTIGHVVGFQSKENYNGMIKNDFPEIAYEDVSGKSHKIIGASKRGPLASPLKSDEVVEVIYLTDNPGKGIVNSWDELYLLPLFFGLTGLGFLVVLRLVLNGATDLPTTNSGSQKKLMKSGVPAIATVIEANQKTRSLHYRIDKEPRMPETILPNFISSEGTFSDWKPSHDNMKLKRGDQFRVYLDSLKPTKNIYVDFNNKIGNNPNVQSMDEEDKSNRKEEKESMGKLTNLIKTSSPFLSGESLSLIQTSMKNEDLSMAFEKLVTSIMNLPKPLPNSLRSINWDDCSKLGIKLGLDEESEDDPKFWEKFQAFKKDQN